MTEESEEGAQARASTTHAAGMCRSESEYDLDSVVLPSTGGCCKFVTSLMFVVVPKRVLPEDIWVNQS